MIFGNKRESAENKGSMLNGHEYVDLGLSVKWATCNVGASNPRGNGDYFAWGETATKNTYTQKSYMYFSNPDVLPPSADAATVNWGRGWRMPTVEELNELRDKCKWTWVSNGYNVVGPNGNGIFLPASGYRGGSVVGNVGVSAGYWSSSRRNDEKYGAWFLCFFHDRFFVDGYYRDGGQSVRPVCE